MELDGVPSGASHRSSTLHLDRTCHMENRGEATFTWERAENKAHVLKSRFCLERYLLVVTRLWTSLGKEIVREPLHERTYKAEESLSERLRAPYILLYFTIQGPLLAEKKASSSSSSSLPLTTSLT
jgi:hypothetical protein